MPTIGRGSRRPLVCPACNKDDALQHVAAVVSSGQSFGAFAGPTAGVAVAGGHVGVFGGYTSMSGVMTNQLAAALAPPIAPPLPTDRGLLLAWGLAIIVVSLVLEGIVLLVREAWSPAPNPYPMPVRSALIGLAVLIGIGAGVCGLLWCAIARQRRKKEKWNAQAFRASKAMNVWSRMYYCTRDHVVFDPQSELSVSANRLQTLFSHWVVFGQGKDIFGSELSDNVQTLFHAIPNSVGTRSSRLKSTRNHI